MEIRRTLTIARWEFSRRARAKGFIVSILAAPIFLGIAVVVPTLMSRSGPVTASTVAVVEADGSIRARAQAWIDAHATLPDGRPAYVLKAYPNQAAADSAVLADSVVGAVVIADSAGWPKGSYRSTNPGDFNTVNALQQAVSRAVRDERLQRAGIDTAEFAALAPDVVLRTVKVSQHGDTGAVNRLELFATAIFMALLLEILILSSGGTMARSLLEEKSGRIMEILVTSARPLELMWGKLLGLTGIGLVQVVAWFGFGVISLGVLGGSSTVLVQAARIQSAAPWLALYLVLGYFLYAAAYVGVGAISTSEDDADAMQSWLGRVLAVPGLVSIGIVLHPDAPWVYALSYIPFCTPPVMMVRLVAQTPSTFELASTLAILAVSIVAVTWLCARIFSTAILMTGKRPTPSEVWRWVREPG